MNGLSSCANHIMVTVKRLRGRKGEAQCEELHCLVRAKAGKRRISTTLPDAEAEDFRAELAVVRWGGWMCMCVCVFCEARELVSVDVFT